MIGINIKSETIFRRSNIMDISILVMACQQMLNIEKPIHIRMYVKRPRSMRADASAQCFTSVRNGKVYNHIIRINLKSCIESEFLVSGIIAHEFIHAKMLENGTFNHKHNHCEKFQSIAKVLEKDLKKLGFQTGKLYNPETDTE